MSKSWNYVSIVPGRYKGYAVASRTGSLISHKPLEAQTLEGARAEAQKLFPSLPVVLPGEAYPS